MNITNGLLGLAAIILGSGGVSVIWQALFNRGGLRAETAAKLADAQALEHKTWFDEARQQYDQIKADCADCKTELEDAEREHKKEMAAFRGELNDLKDALIARADVVDELLLHVQGIADDKLRELKSANRAARNAVYRSRAF
jgi:seryl-tRNA synthetase